MSLFDVIVWLSDIGVCKFFFVVFIYVVDVLVMYLL